MKAESKGSEELDRLLGQRWLSGLWRVGREERPLDPKTTVKPHLWKWADIYDSLVQARSRIDIRSGSVERRVIRLVNPGLKETELTSHTMSLAFQLIQPGEVAPAHRHTMAAIRFILQGKGAYTNVEGQKMVMEDGDLILTPQWTWHEHAHEGDQEMIWIDGLDVPFVQSLQVISFEPYKDKRLAAKSSSDAAPTYGMTRPVREPSAAAPPPLHYRWRDAYPGLKGLAEAEPNPFEGAAMEYVNPLTGGSTLPTLSCWIQMLRPGMRTQIHRHTSTSIYHVFRGSGTTVINGEPLHWEKGDTFIVPLWHWHAHANRSAQDEAILFSMHDAPILKAFGLYREESRGDSTPGL
ncbi:MAG: cupin domain-containing protein [Deltaproteobacteria bacterium]|nr:cupin domain-containing protein [Deltaproteobacteria bacterium]